MVSVRKKLLAAEREWTCGDIPENQQNENETEMRPSGAERNWKNEKLWNEQNATSVNDPFVT